MSKLSIGLLTTTVFANISNYLYPAFWRSSSTKPCEIIIEYTDENKKQNEDAQQLCTTINEMVRPLMLNFAKTYGEMQSGTSKHLDKIEVLWDALKDIGFLLHAVGKLWLV